MKRRRYGQGVALCGLLGILAWVSTGAGNASGEEGIDTLWSPSDIQKYREDFIRNFERTPLNTTAGDAAFLRIMVESMKAQRGVEVGTATGYGAISMGIGFERTGGHLITIEINPEMVRKARENIRKAGLEKTVTVLEGDALKVIPELEGKFDFVFIDAVKKDYFNYFKALRPMLKPGAVIVADNVIQSAGAMRDFLGAMEKDPDYDMVILRCSMEKNDGVALIYKVR